MSPSAKRLTWALSLALLPYLFLVQRFAFVCDDAFISYRYARNFARGKGLVYNPGVEPPVEGYSEFLWVLMIAPFEAMGIRPEVPAMAMGILSGLALVVLTVRMLARRIAPQGTWALAGGALLLGCSPTVAVWSTGGMGTMPFALAVFLLYERLLGSKDEHHGVQAALAAIACVLLRADGALFVFLLGGMALAIGAMRKDRCLLRAAFTASLSAALVFAAHTAWRYGYYGDWLPNTARAKTGGSSFALFRGARYVGGFFAAMPGLAAAALLPLAFGRRCFERPTFTALAGLLSLCAYGVWTGGDFMTFGRFLLPAVPWIVILATKAFSAIEEDGRGPLAGVLAAACVGTTVCTAFNVHVLAHEFRAEHFFFRYNGVYRTEFEQWQDMDYRADQWLTLGRAVALHTDPDDSLVAGAIGALGYESDRFLYDQFGLVTREVALRPTGKRRMSPGHDKAVDRSYFDDKQPTWSWSYVLPAGQKASRTPRVPLDRIRVIELDPADGFEPGDRLILEPPPR